MIRFTDRIIKEQMLQDAASVGLKAEGKQFFLLSP